MRRTKILNRWLAVVLVILLVLPTPLAVGAVEPAGNVASDGIPPAFLAQISKVLAAARTTIEQLRVEVEELLNRQEKPKSTTSALGAHKDFKEASAVPTGTKPKLAIIARPDQQGKEQTAYEDRQATLRKASVVGNVRFASVGKDGKLSYEDEWVPGSFILELESSVSVKNGVLVGQKSVTSALSKLGTYTARKLFANYR